MTEVATNTQTTEPTPEPAISPEVASAVETTEVTSRKVAVHSLRNLNWAERRQSKKVLKEMKKRAGDLYRLRSNYGEEVGTPDFETETPLHRVPTRLAEASAHRQARRIRGLNEEHHRSSVTEVTTPRKTADQIREEEATSHMFEGVRGQVQQITPRQHIPDGRRGREREESHIPEEQLGQLRIYIGQSIGREIVAEKTKRGLADSDSLPAKYFTTIRDKYRRFYVELFLDQHSSLSREDKDKLRAMFGIERTEKTNSHGNTSSPERGERKSKRRDATDSGSDSSKFTEKLEETVQEARDRGLLDDTDLPILLQSIGDNDKRLAGNRKKELLDAGHYLEPDFRIIAGKQVEVGKLLPDEEREKVWRTSRESVVLAHLNRLVQDGVIDGIKAEDVEVLIEALDAAYRIEKDKK